MSKSALARARSSRTSITGPVVRKDSRGDVRSTFLRVVRRFLAVARPFRVGLDALDVIINPQITQIGADYTGYSADGFAEEDIFDEFDLALSLSEFLVDELAVGFQFLDLRSEA